MLGSIVASVSAGNISTRASADFAQLRRPENAKAAAAIAEVFKKLLRCIMHSLFAVISAVHVAPLRFKLFVQLFERITLRLREKPQHNQELQRHHCAEIALFFYSQFGNSRT